MVNVETEGYRPIFDTQKCADCTNCLPVCPGARVDGNLAIGHLPILSEGDREFGPTLEIWEAWATDPLMRHKGSSGGVLSALSLYCLEQEGFAGVIHAGMDPSEPWLNRNFVSTTRKDLLDRAGSRYSPSMPCAALGEMRSDKRYAFVGKPCDTAAVSELQRRDPTVAERVGLIMTFFCAGTPSTGGTLDLLRDLKISPSSTRALHYRGAGWPGQFRVETDGNSDNPQSLSYEESWARLTSYRPLRCNLCPDGLGRVADLSCGDAWHLHRPDDDGRSLVLVRTERGRRVLDSACRAGYVTLRRSKPRDVLRAQPHLLNRRRELFGRLMALRLVGAPVPHYSGFSLFRAWASAGPRTWVSTLAGTLRRAVGRRWHRRRRPGSRVEQHSTSV